MQLTDVDLGEVTESVWGSMLGYELAETDEPFTFDHEGKYLVGCVQITGSFEAAVMVDVPEALARDLASTMFALDDAELSDDDVRDALGEMANMVGGNVKGMLAGDSQLSLPTVAEGRDYRVVIPGGGVISARVYTCAGLPMRVQMIGRAK